MTSLNEIYLRRKGKVLIQQGEYTGDNTLHILTMMKNIESLGYTLSRHVLYTLRTLPTEQLESFYLDLIKIMKEATGAHRMYRPMYPNFPQQVMEASHAELYMNAMVHYWSNGTLLPDYEKEERLPLPDITKLKTVELGDPADFISIFHHLMSSKTSLSPTDKQDLEWLAKNNTDLLMTLLPVEIPLKENVAFISSLVLAYNPSQRKSIYKYFKTATDVLRLAVAMSGGDVSLADDTKFKSFKRRDRRMLLQLLEQCGDIEEDMLRYRLPWIRLGERLHPAEHPQYKKAFTAFRKLRNSEKIETFNGKVQAAMNEEDYDTVIGLLFQRPGEYARKLDHLIRTLPDTRLVINAFRDIAVEVAVPVLLQVKKHFETRRIGNAVRAFFPKGNVAKVYTKVNNLSYIDSRVCDAIVSICEDALIDKFSERSRLGKVYIDENLKDYLVPFSQRSANKSLRTLVRGSRIRIPYEAKTIRSAIYWKDERSDRTDIDLSMVLYDAEWNQVSQTSYTQPKDDRMKSVHSGDITSAPYGAAEFIDIDLQSARKNGVRYVVFSVNVYYGDVFANLPECYMAWMFRQEPNKGEIFEPKTVYQKADLTADTRICIPMILDLYRNDVTWADIALTRNPNYVNNVEGNKNGMVAMGKAITTLQKTSLYDLFTLHARARGMLCERPEEADTVFSVEEGITPFHVEEIMAEYL